MSPLTFRPAQQAERPGRGVGRRALLTGAGAAAALGVTGCGTGFRDSPAGSGGGQSGGPLRVLIGSSGDAETRAVRAALADWSKRSGIEARLSVAADLPQQLSQGMAAGSPPDVFYIAPEEFAAYAGNGSLEPYGARMYDDFYPSLLESFRYEGKLVCVPKDSSTLALFINDELWRRAGLTAKDYPGTWDELHAVARRLSSGRRAGLTFDPQWQRVGAFMAQAGGHLVDRRGRADVDTPENEKALAFVKEMLASKALAYPGALDAGWGGEAFGNESAAMAVEGNWTVGALANDFPDLKYTVVPLPKGPEGPGTLQFTNGWGVAADSANTTAAVDLVRYLVSANAQMTFAKKLGFMPSIELLDERWRKEFPKQSAFLDGVPYAQGVPPVKGIKEVLAEFGAELEGLAGKKPKDILRSVHSALKAVTG